MTERQQQRLQRVLQVFLERPRQRLDGLDVERLAGRLGIGMIYPDLLELEQAGWLLSDWADGYPRRRLYWLNPDRPQHEQV